MNKIWWVAGALALGVGMAEAQTAITHWDLQAVNSTGYTAWVESFPFTIQGVILNDPEEMLDPAYNPGAAGPSSGGQYQVFIQAVAAGGSLVTSGVTVEGRERVRAVMAESLVGVRDGPNDGCR